MIDRDDVRLGEHAQRHRHRRTGRQGPRQRHIIDTPPASIPPSAGRPQSPLPATGRVRARRVSLISSTAAAICAILNQCGGRIAQDSADAENVHDFGSSALLDFRPGIPQRYRAVENRFCRRGIRIRAEVAERARTDNDRTPSRPSARVRSCTRSVLRASGFGFEVAAIRRILARKQGVVEPNLRFGGVRGRNPVNGGFHFAAVGSVAAAGSRVVRAVNSVDLAGFILHDADAGDEVAPAQTDFLARRKTEKLLRRTSRKSSCSI